jgi:CHAT domain-containing protein
MPTPLFSSSAARSARACLLLLLVILPGLAAAQAKKDAPRSIKDILLVLGHYKPDAEAIARAQAELKQEPPKTEDKVLLRNFHLQKARAADKLGATAETILSMREALKYFDEREPEANFVMRQLASAEATSGNFPAALKVNDELIRRGRRGAGFVIGALQHNAQIYSNLGDVSAAERALSNAEDAYRAALQTPGAKLNAHSWLATLERARADVFRVRGKQQEAEKSLLAALKAIDDDKPFYEERARQTNSALASDEGHARQIETVKFVLARVQQKMGRLAPAEKTQREALESTLKRVGKFHVETGRQVLSLAAVIADQGRYAESEVLAREAVTIYEKSGVPDSSLWMAEARRALGSALVASEKHAESLAVFEAMRAGIARDASARDRYETDDLDWVHALIRTGQYKPALEMADRMRTRTRQALGDKEGRTAMVRCYYAAALYWSGEAQRAGPEYGECLGPFLEWARAESIAGTASARVNGRRVLVLDAVIDMHARNAANAGDGRRRGPDPVAASFRFSDIARSSKVQGALNASAARASISDPALAELSRREQDLQLQIRELQVTLRDTLALPPGEQSAETVAKMRQDLEASRKERATIRAQLEKTYPDYADLTSPRPPNVEEIQRALRPGEVLVTVYFTTRAGYVWAIPAAGRAQMAPIPLGIDEVARMVAGIRKALDPQASTIDEIPPFDVAQAAKLYELVFKPVEAAWKGAKSLLFVPHGPLGALPIGLLPTAPVKLVKGTVPFEEYRAVPWLAREIALTQLPSIRAVTGLRRAPPGSDSRKLYLGIGDPYFSKEQAAKPVQVADAASTTSRGLPVRLRSAPKTMGVESAELALLPRLPDTADEVTEIAKALGADPLRDVILHRDANEKRITGMDLSDRKIIHFATHGLVPGELEGLTQPALALTAPDVADVDGDGLLSMDEILGLKLNADWVVLSACNTASGAGEGAEALSGLGSAFFYAGARAMLVSNWPVDSAASRRLMTDLFKRYAAPGAAPKAENLRQAMLGLIDGAGFVDPSSGKTAYAYAHPLFWAPFVLVGD